jgi:hypothetical protein
VNPHAIEAFAIMQAISIAALIVLSVGGSAVFLALLESWFGATNAQRGQSMAIQPRQMLVELPVPRVVHLRTGLARQFESFVTDLSECDAAPQHSGKTESVIARHLATIRLRALELLADPGKAAEKAESFRRED